MEVEHSAWLSEYYCSSKCATDRYFSYMESTPVDFENLPAGVEVVGYKLEICPTLRATDAEKSATSQAVFEAETLSTSDGSAVTARRS